MGIRPHVGVGVGCALPVLTAGLAALGSLALIFLRDADRIRNSDPALSRPLSEGGSRELTSVRKSSVHVTGSSSVDLGNIGRIATPDRSREDSLNTERFDAKRAERKDPS